MIELPNILKEEELLRIYEAALTLLEDVGLLVKSDELLEYYRQAGCKIGPKLDKPRGARYVYFTADIAEQALKMAPDEFTFYPTAPGYPELHMGSGKTYFANAGGDYFRDWRTGELRPATMQDMVSSLRLIDACENLDIAGIPAYWMYDLVPPDDYERYGLISIGVILRCLHTGKPKDTVYFGATPTEVPDAIRTMQICAGGADAFRERPNLTEIVCPISPLYISGMSDPGDPWGHADHLLTCAKAGAIIAIGPCANMGVSGPVTIAGTMALTTAEFLALNVAVQAVSPGNPVFFHEYNGATDMATGHKHKVWPEGVLIHLGNTAMARYLKKPCFTLNDSSSVEADAQAGWEWMAAFLGQALAGTDYVLGAGGLAVDDVLDPCAMLIGNEIIGYVKRLMRGIEVSDSTIALDVMKDVGTAPLGGDYLSTQHTISRHATELWQPSRIVNGMGRDAWVNAGSQSITERAGEMIEDILSEHEPAVPEEQQEALREQIGEILEREGITGDEAERIMEKTYWQGVPV